MEIRRVVAGEFFTNCYVVWGGKPGIAVLTKTLEAFMKLYNVPTQVDIVPGALHAFMHYGRMMPEAVECLERSGAFCKAHLDQ